MRECVRGLLVVAAVGGFLAGGEVGAQAQQVRAQGSAAAAPGSTAVTAWCSGGSTNCAATATCPANTNIVHGYWWYIVPDGVGPAYGICGSNSGSCQSGQNSCAFTTSSSGCSLPGWSRQMGFLYATCQ
jgi:hypothetical protein